MSWVIAVLGVLGVVAGGMGIMAWRRQDLLRFLLGRPPRPEILARGLDDAIALQLTEWLMSKNKRCPGCGGALEISLDLFAEQPERQVYATVCQGCGWTASFVGRTGPTEAMLCSGMAPDGSARCAPQTWRFEREGRQLGAVQFFSGWEVNPASESPADRASLELAAAAMQGAYRIVPGPDSTTEMGRRMTVVAEALRRCGISIPGASSP